MSITNHIRFLFLFILIKYTLNTGFKLLFIFFE